MNYELKKATIAFLAEIAKSATVAEVGSYWRGFLFLTLSILHYALCIIKIPLRLYTLSKLHRYRSSRLATANRYARRH